MDEQSPIAATLAQVGPRLRRVRDQRGVTLSALAEATGISRSTLSRLESGQRRPSLELLLPIAQAHQVPLDELIGAPEVGDPRIRVRPRVHKGRTVIPLSAQTGGVQAWKSIIPANQNQPEPVTHEGYEWLYVLSGRLRLVLADHDLILGPGEAAEFDTRLPHWFGPAEDSPWKSSTSSAPKENACTSGPNPTPRKSHQPDRKHPSLETPFGRHGEWPVGYWIRAHGWTALLRCTRSHSIAFRALSARLAVFAMGTSEFRTPGSIVHPCSASKGRILISPMARVVKERATPNQQASTS